MKKITIRNYTSDVPADKSIQALENILIEMGATAISKEYDNGKITSISFAIIKEGNTIPFKLPARIDAIKKLFLQSFNRSPTKKQKDNAIKQAERTAWKNLKEWVHLQQTMITLEQVEFTEVFMPYMFSMQQGKTAYQLMKDTNYKALLS